MQAIAILLKIRENFWKKSWNFVKVEKWGDPYHFFTECCVLIFDSFVWTRIKQFVVRYHKVVSSEDIFSGAYCY